MTTNKVSKKKATTKKAAKKTSTKKRSSAAVHELPCIEVRGAAEHNLQHVNIDIPKKQLVVFTGPSGSGKSSLAFDTIYAEGQRRYVESLSSYARQFLGQQEKPEFESIRGLSPTIAIEQKSASKNPRSTVGTITEILDYLRVLWARIGTQHCVECDRSVGKRSGDEIIRSIQELPTNSRIMLLAPKVKERKGEYADLFDRARKAGFTRVRVDGEDKLLDEPIQLNKKTKHTIDIVVDRLVIKKGIRDRLADSVETALREGGGTCRVVPVTRENEKASFEEQFYSEHCYCHHCDLSLDELEPNSFSFNSPVGMCPHCNGLGTKAELDIDKLIPSPELSINAGAIAHYGELGDESRQSWHINYRREILDKLKINRDKPWKKLTKKQQNIVLWGADKRVEVNWTTTNGEGQFNSQFEGVIPGIERILRESGNENRKHKIAAKYFSTHLCSSCLGSRINQASAAVRVGHETLPTICRLTIASAKEFFENLELTGGHAQIALGVLREVQSRLRFLSNVGLTYLSLDRSGPSLSGGEAQRIRLASQVGSELTGVLYVLDEPSIGLHQRDNNRLIETLEHLRDIGNSVIVVEHDEDTIRAADHVVDFGPLAGELGGQVVYSGAGKDVIKADTITADYLSGRKEISIPEKRRRGNGYAITVHGARANNLKNIDVRIPLGTVCCITGVSGAGKSSLMNQILYPALANHFNKSDRLVGDHDSIDGFENIDTIICIDQQPIGRTPRSNPATYTKVWDEIRKIFAETRLSKLYGYTPSRFSFNVKGGRCDACDGDGVRRVEMHFLADVFVPCEVCHGSRFNEQTLRVTYKDKTIQDVLNMSVREAHQLFIAHPKISKILQTLLDVGLDYIRLGQNATTLSGGEAQRIKLSRELAKRSTGNTLYILDEPSTGLHFEDVRKLLHVVNRLSDAGNSIVIIEHNLDIIKTADHVIDIGPEGGAGGGTIVAQGTPEKVAKSKKSHTGIFLAPLLQKT